jgi:hypothetical protein
MKRANKNKVRTVSPKRAIFGNKKGLIFTLDALFAILTLIFIVSSIVFFMGQLDSTLYARQSLDIIARDSLSMLERDGTLQQAVDISNGAVIEFFLNALPNSLCGQVLIFDAESLQLLAANKAGCSVGVDKVTTRRSFITTGLNPYYAQMSISFQEEKS